jgi:hypothetical protein
MWYEPQASKKPWRPNNNFTDASIFTNPSIAKLYVYIRMQDSCTRVENPGEGVPEVLSKSLGGSWLSGKIARGGSHYFRFYPPASEESERSELV